MTAIIDIDIDTLASQLGQADYIYSQPDSWSLRFPSLHIIISYQNRITVTEY
jgi:hypothetical protein